MESVIYGICLVIALYLAVHAATAFEQVSYMIQNGEIEKSAQVISVLKELSDRIAFTPFEFVINSHTKAFLIYTALSWFIIVMAIQNSKKNYIHGKEFGTAKWGTISDIRDLFAENIMKSEIRRVNKIKTVLGRWEVRSKLYRECEKNGKLLEKEKIELLKEKAGTDSIRKIPKEWIRGIQQETKETINLSKKQAWKPLQIKADYKERLNVIKDSPLYDEKERKVQETKAKREYEKELKDFFDTAKNIERIREKYKDADMLFTKTERISLYNYVLNMNTAILGGSGSGKSRGFAMPNIMQAHSSYIVTDPKGELLEKSGYFLTLKGYKVRVLNLDDKNLSDGYNPFVYIHPEREGYEERVLMLIETIIINTDGGEKKNGSDPFWDKAERLFLQAIFFFVCDGFVAEERNMGTVLALIRMLKIEEDEDNFDSDLDYFARIFARKNGKDHIGVQQYEEFREKASGKTAKSIVISAVARLAPFRTKAVQKIFSYDSMNLEMVGEEKTAIFVVVPPTDTTFNFIAGMLFTQLFQELQYCATQVHKHDGQRLPVPCRFILDEFANTCTIPNFVKILAYARSFGIGITVILQSLEQIKNMYKDEWGVIIDNCNTLLYLGGIAHMDTLEYMSKLIGKGTYDKRTTGRTRGRQGSSSENFDVVGRELLDSSEIRKLEKKKCILVVSGRNPFYSEKYEYTSHPNYRYTSDANAAYSYTHNPMHPQENVPHGEDNAKEDIKLDLDKTEVIKVEESELEVNPQTLLNEMTKNFADLEFLQDSMMGEEMTEETQKAFFESLFSEDEDIEKGANDIKKVSEETQKYLDDIGKKDAKLETNPLALINQAGQIREEIAVLPDEYYEQEGGTQSEETDRESAVEKIIMEETEGDLTADLEDILNEIDGLDSLIENDAVFREQLELDS